MWEIAALLFRLVGKTSWLASYILYIIMLFNKISVSSVINHERSNHDLELTSETQSNPLILISNFWTEQYRYSAFIKYLKSVETKSPTQFYNLVELCRSNQPAEYEFSNLR